MTRYLPATTERDQNKINQSIQNIGSGLETAETNIGTLQTTLGVISGGQIPFPATQNPSADANTLDDYEEGTWTPVLTFATPGDLSVAYSQRNAYYTKIGRLVTISFVVLTSSFTYTTASGNLLLTGLPFTAVNDAGYRAYAPLSFQGINKASYTSTIAALVGNTTQFLILACGMGQPVANVVAADAASGGTVAIAGSISYVV